MSTKSAVLMFAAVLLAGVYVWFFTDLFSKPAIHIYSQVRPQALKADPSVYTVTFTLSEKHQLTSIKVYSAAEFETNKYAKPLWHLISDRKSEPVNLIVYGENIPGMKPSIPRAAAAPLKPGVPYLLMVEAGKIRGEQVFQTKQRPANAPEMTREIHRPRPRN